jgi:hypothetical protein
MYIFLDIDGVLVTENTPIPDEIEILPYFDNNCLIEFETVMRRHSDVSIVIMSRWRELFDLDTIRSRFSSDIACRISGAAPLVRQPTKYFRYQEIIDYLGQHNLLNHAWLVISSEPEHFPPPALVIVTQAQYGFNHVAAQELESFLLQEEAPPPPASAVTLAPAILGLGWDGTVSAYHDAFTFLAQRFNECVIITLNDELTLTHAAAVLKLDPQRLRLVICPIERIADAPAWTVEQCRLYRIDLMFDNDKNIAHACRNFGIRVIHVHELETDNYL